MSNQEGIKTCLWWGFIPIPGEMIQFDYMGVEPKIGGKPPKSSIFNRVFHYFHHPFCGFSPYFWKHPYDIFSGWVETIELFSGCFFREWFLEFGLTSSLQCECSTPEKGIICFHKSVGLLGMFKNGWSIRIPGFDVGRVPQSSLNYNRVPY